MKKYIVLFRQVPHGKWDTVQVLARNETEARLKAFQFFQITREMFSIHYPIGVEGNFYGSSNVEMMTVQFHDEPDFEEEA